MQEKLSKLISNRLDFSFDTRFYAILGLHVSTTARSPALWNSRLEALGRPERMFPLDVSRDAFDSVLELLLQSRNFLGGAIAVPYKGVAAQHMGPRSDSIVRQCGATNCIFRTLVGGFSCTNTDGIAAVRFIEEEIGLAPKAKIMLLGFGGVGKAIAASLDSKGFSLVVASRSAIAENVAEKYSRVQFVGWKEKSNFFYDCDLFINCTTLGSAPNLLKQSPLMADEIDLLPRSAKVFDVIYNPEVSTLGQYVLDRGLPFKNGLLMNQRQAEFGMELAFRGAIEVS